MKKTFFMKSLNIWIALAMMLPPGTVSAKSARSVIEEQVKESHLHLQSQAQALFQNDFETLLNHLASTLQNSPELQNHKAQLEALLIQIEEMARPLASLDPSRIEMSREELQKLRRQFQQLTRERFSYSLLATQMQNHPHQITTALTNMVESFSAVCRSGKGYNGAPLSMGKTPQVDPVEFEFYVGYENNWTLGSPDNNVAQGKYTVRSHSYTQTDTDQNRQAITDTVNTGTGIISSIALSGAKGTLVGAAQFIAPYAIAVAIVWALVTHYLATEEQARLAKEVIENDHFKNLHLATQLDLGRAYRESCQALLPALEQVGSVLTTLESSEEDQMASLKKAEMSHQERRQYVDDSIEQIRRLNRVALYNANKEHACLQQKNSAPADQALCRQEGERVISLQDPSIEIQVSEELSKDQIKELYSQIEKYSQIYTQEKRLGFLVDQLVEVLTPQWKEIDQSMGDLGLEFLDSIVQSAFNKFDLILKLYTLKNSKIWWGDENPWLSRSEDLKIYQNLKNEFLELVNMGPKVLREEVPQDFFRKKVSAFVPKLDSFVAKHKSNTVISNFSEVVHHFYQMHRSIEPVRMVGPLRARKL